jgi:hypothetical protein
MNALVQNSATLVWVVLMLATGVSWWLGTQPESSGASASRQATLVMMVVAFFKVRLVIMHFMEVREAPLPLQLLCEGWVIITCSAMLGLYLWA